ncbi:MAG: mechanosensitive ion channel family protein [Promethearchaeota archaeon]
MIYQNFIDIIFSWFSDNWVNIVVVALSIIVGWLIYLIIKKQLKRLQRIGKLEIQTTRNLQKLFKFLIGLIIISTILIQFVEAIGLITSLFTLMGGTIVGFAAINTIGNMLAGIIIMISRPFTVGDYVVYKDKIAKIQEIKLIFTILKDLDGIKISVPNQKLITEDTENLGKTDIIRRKISITADYQEDNEKVKNALLEAAKLVPEVLEDPEPYVWITNFLNFAVEYTLFIFINDIKRISIIEANLRQNILNIVGKYNIDISTPSLVKSLDK